MISLGTLVRDGGGVHHRVIHIDESAGQVYFIDVDSSTALPRSWDFEFLEGALRYGWLEVVAGATADDARAIGAPSKKMHSCWLKLASSLGPELIVSASRRNDVIRAQASDLGVRPSALMQLLRWYWQGGCSEDAVLTKLASNVRALAR
jgi:hypothetical protein